MRLQVEIRRNSLPPAHIVYSTSSSNPPVKTVSQFLTALDKIVPLESVDGEWGLEDYVVEVAATADQTNLYECLHYQLIKDVFREDDEVVVRSLTTEDLRERRRGGRLQISSDGRHLFDGVAWGRTYTAAASRPGITIPPRKKRKLLEDDDNDSAREEMLQMERLGVGVQIGTLIDDEDDQDYEDQDEYNEEDGSDGSEDVADVASRQIVAREEFDNADMDEDDESHQSDGDDSADEEPLETAMGLEEDELQLLLTEAGEIEKASQQIPLESRITFPSKKRKRSNSHQDVRARRRVSFEEISSPVPGPNNGDTFRGEVQGQIGDHVVVVPKTGSVEEPTNLSPTPSSASDAPADMHKDNAPSLKLTNGHPESTSDPDSDDSFEISQAEGKPRDDSDSGSESSSDSESNLDSDSESESDPDSDMETTSSSGSEDSDSDSDSGSSSMSSSEESDQESATAAPKSGVQKKTAQLQSSLSTKPENESTTKNLVSNPPGSGTKRTVANNNRVKRRKYLDRLKREGVLSPEADFGALKAYEAKLGHSKDQLITNGTGDSDLPDLARRKEELLARLNAEYEEPSVADASVAEETLPPTTEAKLQLVAEDPVLNASMPVDPGILDTSTEEPQVAVPSPKRARLDIASSRRMLFNSLGLRNPKTPAAEQALREQLSKPVRTTQPQKSQDVPIDTSVTVDNRNDAWKQKLIISAVECLQEGVSLTPPPFPFKQRWEKNTSKNEARLSDQYYEQERDDRDVAETHAAGDADGGQPQVSAPKVLADTRTVSAGTVELNDILHPSEIASLPRLTPSDLHKDAIIAYKELQINAKYEPEESDYRVARITSVEGDDLVLLLSRRYREQRSAPSFDSETGKRLYDRFEMPGTDESSVDDGIREMTFDSMIDPKLIQKGKIQVPASEHGHSSGGPSTQMEDDAEMVPESGPQHDSNNLADGSRTSTQIRHEIVQAGQDAGPSQALDEQLLRPISVSKTYNSSRLSAPNSRASSHQPEAAHTKPFKTTSGGLPEEWRSSSFEPDAENNCSQSKGEDDHSSPPSISMVETVDYPHVSHLDTSHAALQDQAGSSSHQDAQRVSPDVSDIEHSEMRHLRVKVAESARIDSQTSSLPSEVPQSQPNAELGSYEQAVGHDEHKMSFKVLRGGDGIVDPDVPSDSELDSDGLPTLRTLTSSGQQRLGRGDDLQVSSSQGHPHSRTRVSPPALRKSRSHGNIGRRSRSPMDKSFQQEIKISGSQKQVTDMSQIPQATTTSVVDLTVSSDPVDWNENESENEDEDEDGEWEDSPRARRAAARSSKLGPSSKDAARQGGRGRTTKSAFATVGHRKALPGKTRSRI